MDLIDLGIFDFLIGGNSFDDNYLKSHSISNTIEGLLTVTLFNVR